MSYFVCDGYALTIHLSSFTIGQLAHWLGQKNRPKVRAGKKELFYIL